MMEVRDPDEKKRRRIAAIATVLFHVIAIILFIFFGLTQPSPLPEDGGASIEFGWDEAASGDAVADITDPNPVPQQTQQEAPQEEVVEDIPVDEVVTDEASDVAVPEVKEEIKPKPKDPKPKPKPEEKPKPTISSDLSNALQSLNQPSGGGSQGDKDGTGDQGNPKGTTGKGTLGSGSGSWQLDGRSMLPGYGTKINTTTEEGTVVMNIWVDRNGNVTKVQPNLKESNTTSQYLFNLAKTDILNNFKYNGDPNAAIGQRGTVRYEFKLK